MNKTEKIKYLKGLGNKELLRVIVQEANRKETFDNKDLWLIEEEILSRMKLTKGGEKV